jgi:hypothetical protein
VDIHGPGAALENVGDVLRQRATRQHGGPRRGACHAITHTGNYLASGIISHARNLPPTCFCENDAFSPLDRRNAVVMGTRTASREQH